MLFDHVALNVTNIKNAIEWYVSNLDAKVLFQDETWGLVEIAGTRIAFTIPSQHPPHIAFAVDSLEKIPGAAKIHRDGSISSYVSDPDGNFIEYIYWPKTPDQ